MLGNHNTIKYDTTQKYLERLLEVITVVVDGDKAPVAPAEGDLVVAVVPPVVKIGTCRREKKIDR